jgi:ABC-type nickel/cobalt efflux system permease component RcnA
MVFEDIGIFAGAILLGVVHGIEPGHGWPVAASYALDQTNKWLYGFAASLILGVGHLISSIAMVGAFFYAKDYFNLTQVNDPIRVFDGIHVGGPVSLVAGVLLIALGIREYTHGHSHETHEGGNDHAHESGDDHGHAGHHSHEADDDGHVEHHIHEADDDGHAEHHSHEADDDQGHTHERTDSGTHDHGGDHFLSRLAGFLPFGGGHTHGHGDRDEAADRGLLGIAWFAFVLGFAHEEEFEIIALCAGSNYCLELMSAYAITVILGIVGLTMLLIAGYHRSKERIEQYTPYLPVFSAAVLVIMGLGFITGLL